MPATIRNQFGTAAVRNEAWTADTKVLQSLLDSWMIETHVCPINVDPDITLARLAVEEFGGEVIKEDPVEWDTSLDQPGVVY
jgi:hypothetical protein